MSSALLALATVGISITSIAAIAAVISLTVGITIRFARSGRRLRDDLPAERDR